MLPSSVLLLRDPAHTLFPHTPGPSLLFYFAPLQDGIVAEDTQNLQFLANQNMKLPPLNSALPTQSLGSFTGLAMPNVSSVRQVSVPGVLCAYCICVQDISHLLLRKLHSVKASLHV